MSNPWLRSPATTPFVANWPLGPGQSTDNLTGLANGQAKALGVINAESLAIGQTPWGDIIIPPWKITTGSVTTGANNVISRYLIFSEDNVVWPGGINPTSASDQSTALANFLAYNPAAATSSLLDQIFVQTGITVYQTVWYSLRGLIGNVPRFCSIVVSNASGAAFSATAANFTADYTVEYYA